MVGDNESAATLAGTVTNCANSGHVISTSAAALSFVGGVVGRNNNLVSGLYNTGNVECLGSCVGGALGLSTSGATASGLYSSGDVTGANVETATGEDYRIGGAVGNVISGVSDAYYLNTISVATTTGGTPLSAGELAQKAGALANLLEEKPAIGGTLELQGTIEVGATVTAAYTGDTGDQDQMLYVWHLNYGDEESALAITEENTYQIPETLAGYRLHVKALAPSSGGVLTAVSEAVDGMNGTVSITGPAIVGKSVRASYSQEDSRLAFQWYRGSNPIAGARESQYTVTQEDLGYRLKVRVTGSKPGYVEKAMTAQVVTAEDAGVWPDSVCSEPANVGGVYVLTTQAELFWFASEVNGGNTAIKARLGSDLVLTAANWYPIGSSQAPFYGTFDGNGKTISGFQMTTSKGEQGFFGVVGGNGQVKNLHVSGTVSAAGDNALAIGGIAGTVEGELLGCTFSGSVSGTSQVGGIVGMIDLHGMVKECRNTASVSGGDKVGGIAGTSSYGDIYYCVNKGTVGSADAELVGGIVGDAVNYAVITGSYNTGAVTGSRYVGGIAGKVYVASAPLGCYSVGAVTGSLYTGGVLGNLDGTDYITTVTGSFYLNSLPADKTATAKKEAEMKDSSFVGILNRDAYVECYVSDSGINQGYPILKWEKDGHSESGGDQPDLPTKERIDVSFTLVGDTVHGSGAHTGGTTVWIETTQLEGLPNTTTAYDLFRQVLDQEGYTYEATGNSYIAFITSPSGVRLGEFSNGPYSGWMYTINDVFPDYMSSVTLNDGDNMVFFYTDDYRLTGWNPNGRPGQSTSNGSYGNTTDETHKAVNEVMELISAIGTVTKDSGAKIQAAREAYDRLSDAQKKLVSNYETLTLAEAAYAELTVGVPFTDVQGHWALDAIQYVYKNGLMNGVGNQKFQPNGTVNRAMAVTILYRLEKEPAVTDGSVFSDVDCNAWYAEAVAWASANGIVKGIGGGKFAPTADITREQLAVMLYRYAQYKQYDTQASGTALNEFSDYSAISSWAVQAMQWMNSEALMTGRTETTIVPGGTATRAEAAAIFMRFANNCAK